MSKFYDDPMTNESKIIVIIRHVWMYVGKRRVLGEEEGKTNLRGKKSVDPKCKN